MAPGRSAKAFTLVELLSVVSIMLLILGLVAPSLTSVLGAGDVNRISFDLAGLVDSARAEAMAKNSYVWIGFASDLDAASPVRERQLVVAIKSTAAGSKPASLNGSSASLQTLGKPQIFTNVQISSQLGDYGGKKPLADEQFANTTSTDSFDTRVGGVSYNFKKILEINASGEVRVIGSSALPRQIEIGLQPTHGNVADNQGNSSTLQIAGLTGQTKIFRP